MTKQKFNEYSSIFSWLILNWIDPFAGRTTSEAAQIVEIYNRALKLYGEMKNLKDVKTNDHIYDKEDYELGFNLLISGVYHLQRTGCCPPNQKWFVPTNDGNVIMEDSKNKIKVISGYSSNEVGRVRKPDYENLVSLGLYELHTSDIKITFDDLGDTEDEN